MEIKKEYIEYTIDYLEKMHENINTKQSLNEEIELLKQHIDAYRDRDYDISTSCEYKTIADLVITEETKLCIKETQLDQILKDDRFLSVYLSKLNKEYREVIEIRYLQNNEKLNTFEIIGKEMKLSESTARRKHIAAVELIAFYKYGEQCKVNNENDGNVTEKRRKDDGTMHDKVC